MRLSESFRNRQTESEPAVATLDGVLALFERMKHSTHYLRFDSDAGVFNGNQKCRRLWIRRRNQNIAIFARELDRVLHQVPNDLLELCRVCENMMGSGA